MPWPQRHGRDLDAAGQRGITVEVDTRRYATRVLEEVPGQVALRGVPRHVRGGERRPALARRGQPLEAGRGDLRTRGFLWASSASRGAVFPTILMLGYSNLPRTSTPCCRTSTRSSPRSIGSMRVQGLRTPSCSAPPIRWSACGGVLLVHLLPGADATEQACLVRLTSERQMDCPSPHAASRTWSRRPPSRRPFLPNSL